MHYYLGRLISGGVYKYMPNKPSEYGVTIWIVSDSKSSYAWSMQEKPKDLPRKKASFIRCFTFELRTRRAIVLVEFYYV